jgi:hypothetical protein
MNRGDARLQPGSSPLHTGINNIKLTNIPFGTADWTQVPPERKAGERGWA